MRDIGFFALAADEDAPGVHMACDVFAHFFLGPKLEEAFARVMLNMGFPGAVETFQAKEKPSNAAFHETKLNVGELVEDTVEHQAAKGNHLAEGMAKRVDRRVGGQIVQAHVFVGAAVDGDRTTQLVRPFIDWPVALVAQIGLDSRRG